MTEHVKTPREVYADERAEDAYGQALWYVWGRQDAGEMPVEHMLSVAFARYYADIMREFTMDRVGFLPAVRNAFEAWRVPKVGA